MLTRRKLLAIAGSAVLGLAGVGTAVTIRRASRGDSERQADLPKLETVTLTIQGMI